MKKIFISVLLAVLFSSCSENTPVSSSPPAEFKDNIIVTKLPSKDSTTLIYDLNSAKLRYITNLGIEISNVYNNKILVVKFGNYILNEINVFDIKTKTYIQIPRGIDYPTWAILSPDANKVAYTTDAENMLVVFNSDGTNRRVFSNDIRGTEYLFEFSPNGKHIAFVEKNSSYQSSIYVIDTSGNNKTKVVDISEPNSDDTFCWASDSKAIYFANRNSLNKFNICKVYSDGSGYINLTNYDQNQKYPKCSPDGRFIQYVEYLASGYSDLVYMNADGTGKVNLTNTSNAHESNGNWSPDSKKISYTKQYGYGTSKRINIYDIATQNYTYIDSIFYYNWNFTN